MKATLKPWLTHERFIIDAEKFNQKMKQKADASR
jgi:hypothetical protein